MWSLITTENCSPDQVKTFKTEKELKAPIMKRLLNDELDQSGTYITMIIKGEAMTPKEYMNRNILKNKEKVTILGSTIF